MEKYLLVGFVVVIVVGLIAYHVHDLLGTKKGVSLDKAKPVEPAAMIDEGVVMRIGTMSNQWDPIVHILFEDRPGSPISFSADTGHSAIALTQPGDRVRLERESADADDYVFTNLTLGLSATEE